MLLKKNENKATKRPELADTSSFILSQQRYINSFLSLSLSQCLISLKSTKLKILSTSCIINPASCWSLVVPTHDPLKMLWSTFMNQGALFFWDFVAYYLLKILWQSHPQRRLMSTTFWKITKKAFHWQWFGSVGRVVTMTPEVRGSNPVIGEILFMYSLSTVLKRRK